jgi:hypothetical protein
MAAISNELRTTPWQEYIKDSDLRPYLSAKLKALESGPVWCTWPNPKVRIQLSKPDLITHRSWIVFVHKARFGLGRYSNKDGKRALNCKWLEGAGPDTVYVHDIRAVVVDGSDRIGGA